MLNASPVSPTPAESEEARRQGAKDLSDELYIVTSQWHGYTRARDNGHLNYIRDAKLYDKYYYGDQWADDVLSELKASRRPAQTVNMILSTVNAVTGEYLATRQDIDVKPVDKDADESTAGALSKVIHQILHDSHSKYVEKQVFMDGVIQDRGYFDIRMNYEDNVFGDIRENALDPIDVLLDPGGRDYDPKTWAEIYTTRWMTPDQIEEMYGKELADKIRFVDPGISFGLDSIEFDPSTFSGRDAFYTAGPIGFQYREDWKQVRRVRVIERQWYKMSQRSFFLDIATGDTSPVPDGWDNTRVQRVIDAMAKEGQEMEIIKRNVRRVRWTVSCDKFLVFDKWSPYNRFTIIPFFPYYRRGKPFGIVRNLISLQDILNKVSSQEIHVVNTTANSGWLVQTGALKNMTVQQLEQVGAKTGLVIEYNKSFEAPAKIQPNSVPQGLEQISHKAMVYFREVSGVSDAMLGQPGREISGRALESKQQRGLLQLDLVFDNLAYTRQLRGEFMLELIQTFYKDPRIIKILAHDVEEGEQQKEILLNAQVAADEIVNDVTCGKYDVVITSRTSKDTEQDSIFAQLIQLREVGVKVPDFTLIENSNLENRKEVADWVRKLEGAAAPTPEEIQAAQQAQEMELQMQLAAIDEKRAKAQMLMANAQYFMAQAQALPGQQQAEMMKIGMEMRTRVEEMQQEMETSRRELLTRLTIAQKKSQTETYTAGLQTIAKRFETEAKERIANTRSESRITSKRV
jgi:hypothetical protein